MAIIPQPNLPPEEQFTDPEFNFMDESPRGFFPDNQDSNWGYRRKVFSDVIWEIYGQLHTIYSEIFPASSQTYLDEWEYMVGLPQNPGNKTLQQRRQMVLNRLRGGPFTRTQRRLIVESYITATFGTPILLLPPGHGFEIGGSPLYNEPGDVTQLYMIVETVEQFKYEVRIKTGMALDTIGLERDLKWYTPAGIQIIFNYAWDGKFPVDSGTVVDVAGYNFPTTLILDNFNRPNETTISGAWYNNTGDYSIVGNQLVPELTDGRMLTRTEVNTTDVEAYVEFTAFPPGNFMILQARSGGGSGTFYCLEYEGNGLQLVRRVAWAATTLATPVPLTVNPGDAIGIRCVGNVIQSWARISGVWRMIQSAVDNVIDGTAPNNQIGFYTDPDAGITMRLGNFGGGNIVWPRAFPSTPVLDGFNRADGALGANWSNINNMTITNKQLVPATTTGSTAYWANPMPGPDVEVYADITARGVNGTAIWLIARSNLAGEAYRPYHQIVDAVTDQIAIQIEYAAAYTVLQAWNIPKLAVGDAYGIRCVGSTIEGWVRRSGIWELVGSVVDTTIAGTGAHNRVGIEYYPNGSMATRWDNFGAGIVRS